MLKLSGRGNAAESIEVSTRSANTLGERRRFGLLTGLALAMAASVFGGSEALAQNCAFSDTAVGAVNGVPVGGTLAGLGGSPASISSMIGSAITASDTAFLLQSEAFVGAPANPGPNQQGGGIWVRGVGGQVDIRSTTSGTAFTATNPPGGSLSTTINCGQKVDSTFAGVQFGADIARLNVNGWNLHFGSTAGYLGSDGSLVGGAFTFADKNATGTPTAGGGPFTSTSQVPFFGIYGAATHGGFFIDGLLREQYYQNSLNAPGEFLFGQQLDAHGWAFAGSIGYNWAVPNSKWFIEPSAGLSISRTKVDPLNYVTTGTPGMSTFGETLQLNQINSDIGRAGVRFGTTIDAGNIVWQPFGAVSVWHEFGPNITANAATCQGLSAGQSCEFFPGPATFTTSSSTSTFGTYGQYSLGISGALAGTGWLGFARVDYRDGSELQGLSGTGGIRYQFSPEPVRSVMPVKAVPLYKAPVLTAVNWTGLYIGGFGGADLGRADWSYTTGGVSPHIGGFPGGGEIGYNYQMDRWVIGLEAALSGTNTDGGVACGPLLSGNGTPLTNAGPMFQMTCNASDSWLATVTGKLGYTWGRALWYVKGGVAWTNERFAATCNLAPVVNITTGEECTNNTPSAGGGFNTSTGFNASSNRGGWTIGYGGEFALTQSWSAKAETDYVSFGDTNVTASDGEPLKVGMHYWTGKIGVDYHFNAGPVIARD